MPRHRWTDEDLQKVKGKRGMRGSRTETPIVPKGQGTVAVAPLRKSDSSPYKSKLEFSWARRLEVMKREGQIDGWIYEPFTFKLAEGKRYRADFIAWGVTRYNANDGSLFDIPFIIAYECKGWHKNYRDSLTHLKWAAQRFPFFQWKKVVRNGKTGFELYDVVV